MAALTIARHHLLRIARSPGLILLLAAIPLTLALIEYAAFGPTVASGRLPPIKVLVLDEDDTFLSRAVPQFFTAGGPMKDLFETSAVADRAAARSMFQRNQASALLVVPRGFQDALLAGGPAPLQFAPNPLQTYSPQIARSVVDMVTLIGNGLYQQAADPIRRINELRRTEREPTADEIADISKGFFGAGRRLTSARGLADLQLAVVRPTGRQTSGFGRNPAEFFAYVFPGLVMFGIMFISQSLALRLLRDRVLGVERRVAIAPVSRADRHAGALLFFVAALMVLLLLLLLIGGAVFRITVRNPPALFALSFGFALFAAGLHLTITAAAKNDRSASLVGTVIVMLLSLLGGTFVPAENYPPLLRSVAFAMPNGAAQQGFVDVLAHAHTFTHVAGRVATTWAWAIVLTGTSLFLGLRRSDA